MATDFGEGKQSRLSAKVAQKLEKAQAKTDLAMEKAAAKTDQAMAKAERAMAERERAMAKYDKSFERLASSLSALEVWTRSAQGSRRPRFTREEIAATAMRLADAEGFDAVSMRRIAAELGAGTMTLYHYVQTKDELLTLLTDAVMGEVVVPDDVAFPSGWREAMTLIADRSRTAFTRHPWMFDITDDPPLGPNAVRHFDQTLQALAPLEVDLAAKVDLATAVDEYVFGYCLHERNHLETDDAPFLDTGLLAYVEGLVASGDYPQLELLSNEFGLEVAWREIERCMRDPDRFHRNLARLLDGIEADIVSARKRR